MAHAGTSSSKAHGEDGPQNASRCALIGGFLAKGKGKGALWLIGDVQMINHLLGPIANHGDEIHR